MVLCLVSRQRLPRRVRLCSAGAQYITREVTTGFASALQHATSVEMVVAGHTDSSCSGVRSRLPAGDSSAPSEEIRCTVVSPS